MFCKFLKATWMETVLFLFLFSSLLPLRSNCCLCSVSISALRLISSSVLSCRRVLQPLTTNHNKMTNKVGPAPRVSKRTVLISVLEVGSLACAVP